MMNKTPKFSDQKIMKTQRRFLLSALLMIITGIVSCGPPTVERLPFETLAKSENWRLLHHYDYQGSDADRARISVEQQGLILRLRKQIKAETKLAYSESTDADITVTLEERQRARGYGQVGGLSKREFLWWVRFYDAKGELLAEYFENRQTLMRQANNEPLLDELSGQIIRALRGEKIQR